MEVLLGTIAHCDGDTETLYLLYIMLISSPISDCVSYPYVEHIQHLALAHFKMHSNLLPLLTLLDIHSIKKTKNKQTVFTWWSMTKERPQQKPPIEATAFSMLALIRSMSFICRVPPLSLEFPLMIPQQGKYILNSQIHYYRGPIYNGQNY